MKWIISRYNHDLSYLLEYTDDYVLYDRSEEPLEGSIVVPNIGTDIYDKLTYIIDNYDDLPDVAVYTKANIFKYITKDEFDAIKDNRTFTPILTRTHEEKEGFCFYSEDGMYNELNNEWFLLELPPKSQESAHALKEIIGINGKPFLKFAPGSNYIVPKENILKHSKETYIKLRSFLDHAVYPGEAQLLERGLYYLWNS